ncbi:hypothetical protein RB195_026491 [Necator americanus]|uniref:Uncharacterized protein n=1 Tax=Necator americanus TaxID=51031 RepID=A0ABR1EZJ5_NECAM
MRSFSIDSEAPQQKQSHRFATSRLCLYKYDGARNPPHHHGKEQGMVDAVLYALIKPGGDFTYTSAIMDGCFNTFAIRAAENHVV